MTELEHILEQGVGEDFVSLSGYKFLKEEEANDSSWTYIGQDPNLLAEDCCLIGCCQRKNTSSLRKCNRCKLAYYCNRDCQMKDYEKHKMACQSITEALGEVQAVRRMNPTIGNDGTQRAIAAETLGVRIHHLLALKYPTKSNWLAAVEAYREAVCDGDHKVGAFWRTRQRLLSALLHLNRDDEALRFIRIWIHEEVEVANPFQPACRYQDAMEGLSNNASRDTNLSGINPAYLMAAACIKMRVVAALDIAKQALRIYQDTEFGKSMSLEVQQQIADFLIGPESFYETQESHLNRLLDRIDAMNGVVLRAVLYPQPFMEKAFPGYIHLPGSTDEAYAIAIIFLIHWVRIPGSKQRLADRFGSMTPAYDSMFEYEEEMMMEDYVDCEDDYYDPHLYYN